MTPDNDNWPQRDDPSPPEPTPGAKEPRSWLRRKRLFFGLAVVIVIGGLLTTAVLGAAWLLVRWQNDRRAVAPTPAATPLAETAAPGSSEAEVPTVTPGAAPTDTAALDPTAADGSRVNRIAFINSNGQIETVDAADQEHRVVTDAAQRFQFPAWSPDGQHVAAIGRDAVGSGVYVVADEADSESEQIYFSLTQPPFYLYWSPDSRYVSFLANHPRDGIGFHVVTADGADESRLVTTGSPFYWEWSADSTRVLAHVGASGEDARLELIDIGNDENVESIAAPGLFQAPGISSSGRYLAFAEEDGTGQSWLVVTDTETGEIIRERHRGLVAMSWSPTEDKLVYMSGEGERDNFWGPVRLLDASTGEITLLSNDTALAFFWSPNGRYVAFLNFPQREDGDLNALVLPRHRLGKPPAQTQGVELGLLVVDVATGEGRFLGNFQPTAVFILQFLPFFDQYALSHRIWSPGSDALVLPVREGDTNHITIFPIDGGRRRVIGEGDMPFWSQQ